MTNSISGQSSRITRKTWSDRVLKSQNALLSLHSASLKLQPRPVTLGSSEVINVVTATSPQSTDRTSVLVLMHGWGSGLGFFARTLPLLATQFQTVYLVDVPGMGASSRPQFPSHGVDESLDYFVHRLQEMRQILHKEDDVFRKATVRHLAAHSMGAYISVEWMLRETCFDHLILVSPVGVPSRPEGVDEWLQSVGLLKRSLFGMLRKLWKAGVTPQAALKILPTSVARSFCANYISHRYFGEYVEGELEAMTEYCLQLSKAPTAGEKSISTLLQPGAWAVVPLMDRLPTLKDLPVTFVYGDRDWMDWRQGDVARKKMQVATRMYVVDDADHNVFVDNAAGFARVCLKACRDVESGSFV